MFDSPGIQVALDIKFRPVQAEEYDDFVEFTVTNSGKVFRVPVVARLPKLAVKLSSPELSFGCCPVGEVSKATIRVENTGNCMFVDVMVIVHVVVLSTALWL